MVRRREKWKFILLINIILFSVFTKSLPLQREQPLTIVDSSFAETVFPELPVITTREDVDTADTPTTEVPTTFIPLTVEVDEADSNVTFISNSTSLSRNVRPEQRASQYSIEITINERSFSGRAVIQVQLSAATRLDPIFFHAEDLDVQSVRTGIFTGANAVDANFNVDDGLLEINPPQEVSNYIVVIEYTGSMDSIAGLYAGDFNGVNYVAMNLHATNARRVFPCMDELTEAATISFTFNNVPYNNLVINSRVEDLVPNQYRPLQSPASLWGMVAHNFNNINNPTTNVQLVARPGVSNQENQASVAINFYFNNMEEWTLKPYTEIVLDQDGRMVVIALPDIHKDWYALSTVCIWEPYVLMERTHSVKQRKEALTEIAEAISRQWFGYVIYPENWRFQWVITGLSSYAAYDLNREFQSNSEDNTDVTLIDYNTIFVSDVIQEALLRDAYAISHPLEPGNDLFNQEEIRVHIYGLQLLKYKAPAIMWMMNLVLGDEDTDFIKIAAQTLVNSRSLDTVNTLLFIDAIKSQWLTSGNGRVDLDEFLEPWLQTNGYPSIHVGLRQGGVILTQERFGFSNMDQINYQVPLTWTTSINPNFEMDNVRSIQMSDGTLLVNVDLDDDDFVLFNIQGQGYYRVNYDNNLWERIIEALDDPEQRERIHPLNRATLVDDALNMARAGKLDYEVAFRVVLTMQHEIEYPVWKAFVRNMNFIKKRLLAYVNDEDDFDQDIYLRMVRNTVGRVEDELGFYPTYLGIEPSMESLTRGLVMDHACRANYQPCVAAAVDWFYDPDNNEMVNPNIPHEIRPAVYCTMVREGGRDVLDALYARLDIEPVMYERIVIIESLACSRDDSFIRTLLEETVATANNPWSVEERSRIFAAVAESSYANAGIAMNFISSKTHDMRQAYGGSEKLEDLIWILAENMADGDLSGDFNIWVTSTTSDVGDSELTAHRCNSLVQENLQWNNAHLENVYEWIDENDAPTLAASLFLILISFYVTLFNN